MVRISHILIIEDDASISRLLEMEFQHRGTRVDVARDGLTGLELATSLRPDIIVLDILLPGMDGEHVLREIRKQGIATPVIMLTARDRTSDKIRNLETGADDYLAKPFVFDELLARIHAVLRRLPSTSTIRTGDLRIEVDARQAYRGGDEITLTAREFDLLVYLATHARMVMSRSQILEAVWEDEGDHDPNVLDVYVGYLRRKLEAGGQSRLIHTVRGVGFVLREG